jgi:RNA polymerase-interacting CarD/CdnL/TRCF family regulator
VAVPDGTGSTEQHQVVPATAAKVGDTVVCAPYGVGRIVALEQRHVAGARCACLVVDLAAGLRVTLPPREAARRLRSVADRAELERVGATLAAGCEERDGSWTRRIRETKAKLARGWPGDLAEIVRDGACDGSAVAVRLSDGERRVYLQARELLVREICSARGVDAGEADRWIDAQIRSLPESED